MSQHEDVRAAVERFLASCRRPALLEPGEDLIELADDNWALETRGARLVLQAWDQRRNLVRRVKAVRVETPGRLELVVEHFARREGKLFLLDLDRPAGFDAERRSARLVFRERFRQFLSRQYPGWNIAELTTEPNLQHSLSPAYPRGLVKKGQVGIAAIAVSEPTEADGVLSFGLIWLDYLRRRERRMVIERLALFVPAGEERTTCLRMRYLNPEGARCELLSYSSGGYVAQVDPDDVGNLDTHLETCCRRALLPGSLEPLLAVDGVERMARLDGAVSLRVHGLEFARADANGIRFGIAQKLAAHERHAGEIERLARDLARVRSADADDHQHPLWRHGPEAWLESQVRAGIETVDASLCTEPVYSQVLNFAGGERGVIDLLAVDCTGRLAIIELKASADLHLPLQALDYWMRVRWHLERGEFTDRGYFPGIELRREPPRILLVSPSLEFHPTSEAILGHFAPNVPIERIGVGLEWRKGLEVMFRLSGAARPQ
ncbi:MAG TPA: hypothetical protein VN442_17805 [Bryobacteraceae bacterium]|nr:hypothetical protein [Bryobacteraceae bacterium]